MEWHSQTDRINKFDSEGLISSESDNILGSRAAQALKQIHLNISFGEFYLASKCFRFNNVGGEQPPQNKARAEY